MFTFANFFPASTIEEAYAELMKNRKNVLLGGTSYLRMGNTNYNTAVDISNVTDIDKITEKEDSFEIGAMVSFRQLEIDKNLYQWFSCDFNSCFGYCGGAVEKQCKNRGNCFYKTWFF